MKERTQGPGCGIVLLAASLTQMDKPRFYEQVLKKHGVKGLDQILSLYHDQLSQLPKEIIDNPEKVSQMREAVNTEYNGGNSQIIRQAASKVVTAFEKRLVALGLDSVATPSTQAKIDFAVAMGKAVKACLDFPRLAIYSMPIVRDVQLKREIRIYGEPQEAVNPDLFQEVCSLVDRRNIPIF